MVLKYPGGKWNIAKELVGLIPEHHSYLEPFFGGVRSYLQSLFLILKRLMI